jgi:hypothetical protein
MPDFKIGTEREREREIYVILHVMETFYDIKVGKKYMCKSVIYSEVN